VVTAAHRNAWVAGWSHRAALYSVAAIVVAAAVTLLCLRLGHRARLGAAVLLALAVVIAGGPVQSRYLGHRYRHGTDPRTMLYAAFGVVHHSHVGVIGFPMQYPLYGGRLDNTVDYVGQHGPKHSFEDYRSCTALRAALSAGRYKFVVVEPFPHQPPPPAAGWLGADPQAKLVFTNLAATVFQLPVGAPPDDGGCTS
jgi:hypothetical protein